ncbi:MAG: sodium-dependent transporter [Lewinellaceae bacterium]|nr:sodium-dependent transporter [Saprospiraceae bacterium]MCB9316023.1 sodium-dependent transporter [Lewinellaceae bacterium]MCB9330049.1 sodium-dependent transporter [Lewinellaceae bacterium]
MSNESWGSRVGLVLAMAGNAVGLGNFLRFPVQAIDNGGGTFIIPYLVCFLLMGLPLLFIEWSMGRFGGRYGHHSTPFILDTMDKRRFWKYLGVFGLFTNIAVAAYYCYIESWALSYAVKSLMGVFGGMSQADVSAHFDEYVGLGTSWPIVFWILCLALNTWVLSRGLSGGIEMVAKFAMPLLIMFGILLAVQGLTLTAGEKGAINDGWVGLNWLWEPDFSTIWSPKVWLAAAGQIFFTLSVGMGTIQCYASYMRSKDDIALNAMSAGWMNEFVEVVLGAAVVIPICVGYFGIEDMKQIVADGGGFGLAFKTLPYLFNNWGEVLAIVAGFSWFGLLFFAGITSSLAMGTPFMGFLEDEFGFNKVKAALSFGLFILLLGAPAVIFFNEGVFDEFDYWAGTVSLVVFAVTEVVLFSWVFGMEKGWKEITDGADITVPSIFKFIIKWVTPLILIAVFIGSFNSIWDTIMFNKDTGYLSKPENHNIIIMGRMILVAVYLGLSFLVWVAYTRRRKTGRIT